MLEQRDILAGWPEGHDDHTRALRFANDAAFLSANDGGLGVVFRQRDAIDDAADAIKFCWRH